MEVDEVSLLKPENVNLTLSPHSTLVSMLCETLVVIEKSQATVHVQVHFMFCVCVSDVYLCAVLICCVGLLCMCMFTVAVGCQYVRKKRHLKGTSYFLFTMCINIRWDKMERQEKSEVWKVQFEVLGFSKV